MQDAYMCGAVLIFILLDIVSGYGAALKNSSVSSSKMREGIFKKCGSVVVMLCAVAVEHMGSYVGIVDGITNAVVYGVCALLVIMELTSVLENACKLNPDLPVARFFDLFGLSHEDTSEIASSITENLGD